MTRGNNRTPSLNMMPGNSFIILAPKSGHNRRDGIEEHATACSYMHHTTPHGNGILFSPGMQTPLASHRCPQLIEYAKSPNLYEVP
jgi:hypothetical protein